jgi:hypothetical protein
MKQIQQGNGLESWKNTKPKRSFVNNNNLIQVPKRSFLNNNNLIQVKGCPNFL